MERAGGVWGSGLVGLSAAVRRVAHTTCISHSFARAERLAIPRPRRATPALRYSVQLVDRTRMKSQIVLLRASVGTRGSLWDGMQSRADRHRRVLAVFPLLAAVAAGLRAATAWEELTPGQRAWLCVASLALGLVAASDGLAPERIIRRYGLAVVAPSVVVIVSAALWWYQWDAARSGATFLAIPPLVCAFVLRREGAVVVAVLAFVATCVVTLSHGGTYSTLMHDLGLAASVVVLASLIVAARDENEALVHRLRQAAGTDPLTGLVTRRVLDDALTSGGRRELPALGQALVIVDLDRFKCINDDYGHPVGDDALRHVAGVLRRSVSLPDVVVARLGGDEMAVLLNRCTVRQAEDEGRRLVEAVRQAPLPMPEGQRSLRLTVSVGVAHVTPRGERPGSVRRG